MIDGEVGRDAIEPGRELCLGAVAFAGAVDAQKYFLSHLLRDCLVAHHAEHEVNHGLVVLLDQVFKA